MPHEIIGAAARELGLDLRLTASCAARASGLAIEAGEPERQVAMPAPAVMAPRSTPGRSSPMHAPFDGERDIVVHRAA